MCKLSIALENFRDAKILKRSLDSILIHNMEDVEVLTPLFTDSDCSDLLKEYSLRFPERVRVVLCQQRVLKNAFLNSAKGSYVLFLKQNQILSHDFGEHLDDVLAQKDTDIVALNELVCEEASAGWKDASIILQTLRMKSGNVAGVQSLELYLSLQAGNIDATAKLYKVKYIQKNNIRFKDESWEAEILFNIESFYFSSKTAVIPYIAVYCYGDECISITKLSGRLKAFAHLTQEFDKFACGQAQNLNRDICDEFTKIIYRKEIEELLPLFNRADKTNSLKNNINYNYIQQLACNKTIVKSLIYDYALLNAALSGIQYFVAEKDLDWRGEDYSCRHIFIPVEYEYSSPRLHSKPLLSVVIPNYNKSEWLQKCLASVLTQSFRDFEVLILDDCSSDESWDVLCHYADQDARVRLWRMPANCRQGICRNFAISNARGSYLTFIDSDDYIEPYFFEQGIKQIEKNNVDMVIFGFQCKGMDGEKGWRKIYQEKIISGSCAQNMYIKDELIGACWSIIYCMDFVRASDCWFAEGIYHQDHFFVGNLLAKARSVLLSKLVAYNLVFTANSSTRPKTKRYLHIHSGCEMFRHMASITENNLQKQLDASRHLIWNLETMLLHSWQAFQNSCGEIAITDHDFATISSHPLFMLCILLGFVRMNNKASLLRQTYADKKLRFYTQKEIKQPLLSVIVPAYNQEKLIGICLQSILSQSMRSFELIIIDDASTDSTYEVCKNFMHNDGRIRLLRNSKNMGQGVSRNRALKLAKGKYATFVDSDDQLMPDFFMRGICLLNNYTEIDLVHFDKIMPGEEQVKRNVELRTGGDILKEYCIGESRFTEAWGSIYRRDFLIRHGIRFPAHLYEDSPFLLNVFLHADKILEEPQVAYVYSNEKHPASAMNAPQFTPRHVHGNFALAASISNFFKQHPEIDNGSHLAYARLHKRWHLFVKKKMLACFAKLVRAGIKPLSSEDMDNLAASPEFFRIILEDYARIYAKSHSLEIAGHMAADPLARKNCISCLDKAIRELLEFFGKHTNCTKNAKQPADYGKLMLKNVPAMRALLSCALALPNNNLPAPSTGDLLAAITGCEDFMQMLFAEYAQTWQELQENV